MAETPKHPSGPGNPAAKAALVLRPNPIPTPMPKGPSVPQPLPH